MLNLSHPTVDIAITCSNFAASLNFYHNKLGFEIVLDLEIPDDLARDVGLAPTGFRQVRLQAGNTLIKLMDIESPPPAPADEFSAGVRWLTFFVEDIQQTVKDLRQNGVEFLSEPISAPDAAGVVCATDPDGILIELVQI
ncbi:VOC family protein [Candidatus Poribacteria bacterium]|nr:VOC family protein [Candidatus Poribacteria bacterium]MYG07227.1 VOC family protein [Candidatus Poribacteria bacterium]MYK21451.1 VOC family protein [Candidatus Poribacteria bacterium]